MQKEQRQGKRFTGAFSFVIWIGEEGGCDH